MNVIVHLLKRIEVTHTPPTFAAKSRSEHEKSFLPFGLRFRPAEKYLVVDEYEFCCIHY